ncbi:Valine--tRNA ligase [bacterium HR17]|uniref:Valine--tRNA ligase n=1 Tax=Candidatus Fervidibacter japonicus TaxID=2035412 RepID=A0A2H5XD66_9BACT|nr:Valine--tRNA ligase [bacterium HR17]
MDASTFPTAYDPKELEERWYRFWDERGFFYAEVDDPRRSFCITIPPPNVTGSLHMGHALNHTIHDVVARYKRMKGFNVLVVPGTDHAGIATQVVVEKELAKEGKTRYDLGREKFLERVWAWKEQYGGIILQQMRRLGCSYDWRRERFTMDARYAHAVLETFLRLWNEGLIYRGYRIVNWCPRCLTALSDLEVERNEEGEPGQLWFIRYPLKRDGRARDEFIVVATTRPETMLGDTAVAVHPDDERYKHLIGATVILPLVGREIPVVADPAVDPAFGTGAVKVTPAHDPADFDIAERHGLPKVLVIDDEGHMVNVPERFNGLDRFAAREEVVKALQEQGLLERVEDYRVPLGRCYRCDTVIEPLLSLQWFVRMKPLADLALQVIREGKIRYLPERFARLTMEWLENIKDWCISRQIWWGHRIPIWYCLECNAGKWELKRWGSETRYHFAEDAKAFAAIEAPQRCPDCGSANLVQDPDVLDTWFSSAIWPHAVLGWPDDTPELRKFYPTDLMITARDILYLWVARMVMTGVKFAGDIPFRTVYVHPTVLTREGKRMSKSLGTGIDPLNLLDKYGADGLRFGLIVQAEAGQDLRFHEERLEMARNFGKKLWNATRFIVTAGDMGQGTGGTAQKFDLSPTPRPLSLPVRWIFSRLHKTVAQVNAWMDAYELADAAKAIYNFVWDEFCDWFVEISKPAMQRDEGGGAGDETAKEYRWALVTVLETALRLLHPFMPFVTEELWQRLMSATGWGIGDAGQALMVAKYPEADERFYDDAAERQMQFLIELVRRVRAVRADLGIPTARVDIVLACADEITPQLVRDNMWWLQFVGRINEVQFVRFGETVPQAISEPVDSTEVFVPLTGLVDISKLQERWRKRLSELTRELERVQARLNNPQFVERAPEEVVEAERRRLMELQAQRMALERRLQSL